MDSGASPAEYVYGTTLRIPGECPNKRSLQCPYSGPHKVINRLSDRILEIDVNGKNKSVSIENEKPAHFVPQEEWIAIRNDQNGKPTSENVNLKISS